MAEELTENTPRRVPIVAIRGSVVFPHTDTILTFGRTKSVSAINTAFQEDRVVAVFTQKDPRISDPGEEDLYKMGTICTITQMMSTDGEIHALVRGQARIELDEVVAHEPHLVGNVVEIKEETKETAEIKASAKRLLELFKKGINLGKQAEIMMVMRLVSGQADARELVDQVASLLEIKTSEKQKLLEMLSLEKRLKKVIDYLAHEVNILKLENTITSKKQ